MTPPMSESYRMTRMGWAFCEGCGRKMLKEHMHKDRCIPCEMKKNIAERDKRTEACLMSGKQSKLIRTI